MKNIKKSLIDTLNKKVQSFVLSNGGQVIGNDGRKIELSIDNDAGKLNITILSECSSVASIFCRFLAPLLAFNKLEDNSRLNQYSGKFNFHYSDTNTCFYLFTKEMDFILNKEAILF